VFAKKSIISSPTSHLLFFACPTADNSNGSPTQTHFFPFSPAQARIFPREPPLIYLLRKERLVTVPSLLFQFDSGRASLNPPFSSLFFSAFGKHISTQTFLKLIQAPLTSRHRDPPFKDPFPFPSPPAVPAGLASKVCLRQGRPSSSPWPAARTRVGRLCPLNFPFPLFKNLHRGGTPVPLPHAGACSRPHFLSPPSGKKFAKSGVTPLSRLASVNWTWALFRPSLRIAPPSAFPILTGHLLLGYDPFTP